MGGRVAADGAADGNRAADIEAEAAQWVARLDGGPLTAEERARFRGWLEAHPDHRPAFEEAHATWRSLGGLRGSTGWRRPRPQPRRSRAGVAVALVAGLLGLGALLYGPGGLWIGIAADHRTATGEQRHLRLPDGSEVELGPDSALALHYSAAERRVTLLAGEAFFRASPLGADEARPFVVEAGGGATTALGTEFTVELGGDGAEVVAVQHQVRVAMAEDPAVGVVLSPGDAVSYRERRLGPVRRIDIDAATAWRRGLLVFDAVPLDHVVETLNRYRRDRIVVLGQPLADRRVTGVFRTDDLGDAIETISGELGIRVRAIPPLVTVLY